MHELLISPCPGSFTCTLRLIYALPTGETSVAFKTKEKLLMFLMRKTGCRFDFRVPYDTALWVKSQEQSLRSFLRESDRPAHVCRCVWWPEVFPGV